MKALVIVAHGSRRGASNDEVRELACQLAGELAEFFPVIEVGFLELAEPLIPEALERAIAAGATDISVFPYFLSAGRHVVKDVPDEVKSVQEKYPHLSINMLTHLGAATGFTAYIASVLKP